MRAFLLGEAAHLLACVGCEQLVVSGRVFTPINVASSEISN